MKTLHYRRHSLRDGVYIGEKGLALAFDEGQKARKSGDAMFDRLFHGPLVLTAQTALKFCEGLDYVPTIMPIVEEIGTEQLMKQIGTDAFRAAKTDDKTWLQTTINVHGLLAARTWAQIAVGGVGLMFEDMSEGETAIAFGHSPVIDLVVWSTAWPHEISVVEMEGYVFTQSENGAVQIAKKIDVVLEADLA